MRMAVGTVARFRRDVAINQDLAALFPNERIDSDYLFQWLNTNSERLKAVATGTTVKGLRKDVLLQWPLLLPPLDEQRRIADVLQSFDVAVEYASAVFDQKRRLKDKLVVSALSGGIDAGALQDTAIGPIPRHWRLMELREVALSITVGIASSATHAYRDSGVPLLRNQNIKAGHLDLSDLLFVSPEYDESYSTKRVRTGDVITMRTGYPGKSAVVPEELSGCQTFTTLITRPNQQVILPRFLCEWINSEQGMREVGKRQAGGAQQNLNAGVLKTLPIPVPPLAEQTEIVELLDSFHIYNNALENLKGLRAELGSNLLSGRVRVPA